MTADRWVTGGSAVRGNWEDQQGWRLHPGAALGVDHRAGLGRGHPRNSEVLGTTLGGEAGSRVQRCPPGRPPARAGHRMLGGGGGSEGRYP